MKPRVTNIISTVKLNNYYTVTGRAGPCGERFDNAGGDKTALSQSVMAPETTLRSNVGRFDGPSTVQFTVLFGTAIPQVPRFYHTVTGHHRRSSNTICVVLSTIVFETISFELFCHLTKQ